MADRSPPEFPLLERLGRARMRPRVGAVKSRLRDHLPPLLGRNGDRLHPAGVPPAPHTPPPRPPPRRRPERVRFPGGDDPPYRLERLRRQRGAPDLDAERGDELRLHGIRQQPHRPTAARAAERRRERAVAGQLALLKLHLLVALHAQELHSRSPNRTQISAPGCQGMRASTGTPNSADKSAAAEPVSGPPAMFSMMPMSGAPWSTARRVARRTASRDSIVGIVTVSTAGACGTRSMSSAKRCRPGGRPTKRRSSSPPATADRNSRSVAASSVPR